MSYNQALQDYLKKIDRYEGLKELSSSVDPVRTWLGAEKQVKDRVDEALHPLEALQKYRS